MDRKSKFVKENSESMIPRTFLMNRKTFRIENNKKFYDSFYFKKIEYQSFNLNQNFIDGKANQF